MCGYTTTYKLSAKIKKHRTGYGLSNTCHLCKMDIDIGDIALSKRSNGKKKFIYHIDCAKKVNLL